MRLLPLKTAVVVLFALAVLAAPTSDGSWRELGPHFSGRVSAIAVRNANEMWAASPGGGVWKSTNGGANWSWAGNYGMGDYIALDLAFDRQHPERLYLRTWNGFLVSTDGGAHWRQTLYAQGKAGGDIANFQPAWVCGAFPACPPFADPPLFEPHPFTQMEFSPQQSVLLTALPCSGIEYSIDSGVSFHQLWPFPGEHPELNPDNCVLSIAGDEATHRVWFASLGSGGSEAGEHTHLFRSAKPWTAAGPPASGRWQLANAGITQQSPADSLVWGGRADRLMAIVPDWDIQPNHATAYLFDGNAWRAKPFRNPECIMAPARALVWGGGEDFFVGGVTFAYTRDAGNTWTCPQLNQQYVDIRAIQADPKLRRVWIAGDQSALGQHWVISSYPWTPGGTLGAPAGTSGAGMSTWQAYSVAVAPRGAHKNRVIVGAQDVAAACSDDNGAHWALLRTDEPQSVMWRANGSADVLYSYSTLSTMQRSTNAGSAANCGAITFTDVSPPDNLRESKAFVGPHAMAVQPNNPNRIFIVSARSILYSTNGGTHWAKSPFKVRGRANPPAPTSIFVDEAGTLYVGTQDGGAYTCSDSTHFCSGGAEGSAWTAWGLNSGAPRMITAIAESNAPPAPRTFWMATSSGLYRRLPGANEWAQVRATPGYVYSDVAVDPTCHTRVYTALGYLDPILRSRGGIEFSSDNGARWTTITTGVALHNVPIPQVLVAPESPGRLLAATYGRGVWEYDSGTLPPCR